MKWHLFYIALFSMMICAIGFTEAKAADTRVTPQSNAELQLSFSATVKKAAPAVVNIYTKRLVRERVGIHPFFNDPFFNQFFGQQLQERQRLANSLGSGVIVNESGIVITNNHVVKDAEDIVAVLNDGREIAAELILTDPKSDLAVLRLKPEKAERFKAITIADSDHLEVGDLVLAIGNPFGVGQTVTSGIISATARTAVGVNDIDFFIQTDAAINPGNSGGALVNIKGELIGINSAIFSKDGGSLGIGFAVPSNMVQSVVASAEMGKSRVVRPWLGLTSERLTGEIAEALGLERTRGVLVKKMHSQSPLLAAGIKVGDVILTLNDNEVHDPQSLHYRISSIKIGDEMSFGVYRRNEMITLKAKAMIAPAVPAPETWSIGEGSPFVNITVANISPALIEEIETIGAEKGVAIVALDERKAALAIRMGLRRGDVISEINGLEIKDVATLRSIINEKPQNWLMTIQRGDRIMNIRIAG
jgi:serine protease Do